MINPFARRSVAAVAAGLAAMAVPVSLGLSHASASGVRDHDGMPARWERAHGLNPRINDAQRNPDHDGVSNIKEFRLGTDPQAADSDDDGLDDGDELAEGTDPTEADSDGDGLDDGDEVADGTDPEDADSDDDGVSDGDEVAEGTDPEDGTDQGDDSAVEDSSDGGVGTDAAPATATWVVG